MEDPYRSPSSPSTQRPPPKRWYLTDEKAAEATSAFFVIPFAVWVLITALVFIGGWLPSSYGGVLRGFAVVALFAAVWCAAFLRRGHNPPKGSLVIGGDDE